MKSTQAELTHQDCLERVKVIEALLAKPSLSQEQQDCLECHVKHLEVMLVVESWPADKSALLTTAIAAAGPRRAKA